MLMANRVFLLFLGLALGGSGGGVVEAQSAEKAHHTVTIQVEETSQIELDEGPELTIEQGESDRATSRYTVETNRSAAQSIDASVEIEDPPEGLTLRAEMQAPESSGTSTGAQMLLEEGADASHTLVEGMGQLSQSGLEITYEATSTPEVSPGAYDVTVVYTIAEE